MSCVISFIMHFTAKKQLSPALAVAKNLIL